MGGPLLAVRAIQFLTKRELLLCTIGLSSLAQSPAKFEVNLGIPGIKLRCLLQLRKPGWIVENRKQRPAELFVTSRASRLDAHRRAERIDCFFFADMIEQKATQVKEGPLICAVCVCPAGGLSQCIFS